MPDFRQAGKEGQSDYHGMTRMMSHPRQIADQPMARWGKAVA